MRAWIPPGISRARVAVLIIAPVVVFIVLAFTGLMFIGMVAFFSAMGHGSLTRAESIPYFVVGGIITLGGSALAMRVLERMLIAAKSDRTPEEYALVKRTRTLSAALAAVVAIGGPPLMIEAGFQRKVATARSRGGYERTTAIYELGRERSSRAYGVLRDIASDKRDDPNARVSAAQVLADYPEAKSSLIALTHDENPDVRAAAGNALLMLADDDDAWSNIERLVRDDDVLTVRERMASSLASGRVHPAGAARRLALLKALRAMN
jgi:HEAT repeat protein